MLWVSIIGAGLLLGTIVANLVPDRLMRPSAASLWGLGVGCLLPLLIFAAANIVFRMLLYPRGGWDNVYALLTSLAFLAAILAGLTVMSLRRR